DVDPIRVNLVSRAQLPEQVVEEGQIALHLLRSDAPTLPDRVGIRDDEPVLLSRLVQLRVLRHHVLAVNQHSVEGDYQRGRFCQVHRLRHNQTVLARRIPDLDGFGSEVAVFRPGGAGEDQNKQDLARKQHGNLSASYTRSEAFSSSQPTTSDGINRSPASPSRLPISQDHYRQPTSSLEDSTEGA